MKSKKKIFLVLLVILFLFQSVEVHALDDVYEVYDASSPEVKESFDNFNSALYFYNQVSGEYKNAVLKENEHVIDMEYGIVEFKTNEGCTLETTYFSNYRNYEGSINGCYGIDGAYIARSSDFNNVYFYISGDYASTNKENVILHPFEELNVSTSKYEIHKSQLFHNIKTQLQNDFYSYSINLGEIKNIKDGEYYSYDGHYFYNDFYSMIDDYQNNKNDYPINIDNPYYNYYQYLSHRSLSNYSYQEIENYFYNELCINNKLNSYNDHSKDNANDIVNRSQYYNELKSFFEYQYLYGSNALMMLSESINESSYGKSLSSYMHNNLFAHFAYESDNERNNSRYNLLESSIYSHAKYYISGSYSNHRKPSYYGSFFGNKVSGMNVMYSSDPYWGEKAAYNYSRLDKTLGEKDKNNYCLGIINKSNRLNIYKDKELKHLLYQMNNVNNFSFIILKQLEDVYMVQIDPSFNSDNLYDFEKSVAYIYKDNIDYLINEDKVNEYEFVNVVVDGNGGLISGQEKIEFKIKKGDILPINSARKEGYKYIGFNKELVPLENDENYIAQYQKINKIELSNKLNLNKNDIYDLRNAKLKVFYEDGETETIDIDSQMIEFDDDEINVVYCGLKLPVSIKETSPNNIQEELISKINKNIESYTSNKTFNKDDLSFIKENITKTNYLPSFKEVRLLDEMLLKDFDKKIFIDDELYNLSISGIGLSAKQNHSILFNLLNNTYYIKVKKASKSSYDRLQEVASAYNFDIVDAININMSLNYQDAFIDGPVIIQLNIDDLKTDKVYSVYHLNNEGDVVKCRTTQTNNYIQFMTEEFGDFMILNLDSANNYVIDDSQENISIDNDYFDNHGIVRSVLVFALISLLGFIMIISYYLIGYKKERLWKDYIKSLHQKVIVQEEKPKN